MGSNCAHSKGLRAVREDYCGGRDRDWREVLAVERGTGSAVYLGILLISGRIVWLIADPFDSV